MPLSYKIIKKHQVGVQDKNFEIPITSAKAFENYQRNLSQGKGQDQNQQKGEDPSKMDEIIRQAKSKAQEILNQAAYDAQEIREKAYDTAYQEGLKAGQQKGYQQGFTQGMEQTKQAREQAKELLQQTHRASREYIHQTQEEIIDLAATMAKSIVHYTIDLQDENILDMIYFALRNVEERKQITIRCHPKNILLLKNHLSSFKKICPHGTFTFLEDKEIEVRDCVIETEAQIINLKIDEQIENIKRTLLEMRQTYEV